jgi:hypothetical protein
MFRFEPMRVDMAHLSTNHHHCFLSAAAGAVSRSITVYLLVNRVRGNHLLFFL